MGKSAVSIVKGTDPDKMVEEALSLLGGVRSLIKRSSNPMQVIQSHPKVVYALAQRSLLLLSKNCVKPSLKKLS